MAFWRSISSSGIEIKFLVQRNGALVADLAFTDFAVTVVDPDDSANIIPVVTQTTQLPGMYKFTVPSVFLTTNGVGHYGIRIGVHKADPSPINDEVLQSLEVTQADIDLVAGGVASVLTNLGTANANISRIVAAIIAADLVAAVGSTDTIIRTNATQASGFYDGLLVVVRNAAGAVARKIQSHVNLNGALTLDLALPFTPAAGNEVIILGRIASAAANVDTNAVATAVWAKSILVPAGGSYGELVNQVSAQTGLIPGLL